MDFSYFMPTRIFFGSGGLGKLSEQQLPGKKALIVTTSGGSVKKYGTLDKLTAQLDMAKVEYALFDKILPNPIYEHVMEGAKIARDNGCDFVIGLGGGSAIDSSKSIAVMATNSGDYWDYVGGSTGKRKPLENKPLPIVAITTTAGTGTESDPWTVITKNDTNEKIGFGNDGTFPVLSIVDASLMVSVPPHLTAYQGFDALFHSTEGYLNTKANPISDMFALKAIELIGKSLPVAVRDGKNIDAREDVALANTLSGVVESVSGCISMHSMEHALSAFYPELPHGAGLIMVSREYYTVFAKSGVCDERMVAMAKALGNKDAKTPMDFVETLLELQKKCGVDALKMSEYGIEKDGMAKYMQNARETMGHLFAVDPYMLSDEEVVAIYEKSYM